MGLYKSAAGKARGIFRYSANTQTNAQTRSGLQRLLRPIMHLGFVFPAFTDAFRGSTCISELIFQQIRITFPLQMHPCQTFSANQDHFPLANASLNRLSCKSGSLFPRKCIPARIFPRIRITSPSQMHPCQTFSANQDHFSLANASLPDLFCKSGSLLTSKTVLEYRQEAIAGVIPQVPSPQSDNPCDIRFWKAIPHRRIRLQRSRRCRFGAGIHCRPLRQSPPCRLRSKDTCPSEAAF